MMVPWLLVPQMIFAWNISNLCMHYHHPILMQWPLACGDEKAAFFLIGLRRSHGCSGNDADLHCLLSNSEEAILQWTSEPI